MGVQTLSSEVRGFLYGLFNQASNIFQFKAEELGTAPEAQTARDLSFEFMRAQGMARRGGNEATMNETIQELLVKLDGLTDQRLKDAVDELRDWQKLYFRRVPPQQQADLGTYSKGIF
jgi:hypothetical protein